MWYLGQINKVMNKPLIFENWKPRASSFGHLLTCLPPKFTDEDQVRLSELLDEKISGKNTNGNTTKWTDTKQKEVDKLKSKKKGEDVLPTGAITKLEEIFDDLFWKRRKLLHNKYLDKGTITEEDGLELLSIVDGIVYWKNDEFIENEYSQGTYDNLTDRVRDIKSNFELSTFRNAELTDLYEWQIKDYAWMLGITEGELVYVLVNSPWHIIEAEKKSLWFKIGMPDQEEERWIEAVMQLERNHIFDIKAFRRDYPNVDLENTVWTFDIPPHMRVKRFPVTLTQEDINHMTRRSKMCKEWLINREKKELELINNIPK